MHLTCSRFGSHAHVAVVGTIDWRTVADLVDRIDSLCSSAEVGTVQLDLRAARFCDGASERRVRTAAARVERTGLALVLLEAPAA